MFSSIQIGTGTIEWITSLVNDIYDIVNRSGVQMLPVFIGRQKKLFSRVPIIFGKPYDPQYTGRKGTAEEYQANAEEVMRQAYALGGIS